MKIEVIIEVKAETSAEYLKLMRLGLAWRPAPHHTYDKVEDTIFIALPKDLDRIVKI